MADEPVKPEGAGGIYIAPNGTEIEFVKREVYWQDGHLMKGEESPVTVEDARFIIEEVAKAKRFEANRKNVWATRERLTKLALARLRGKEGETG